MMHLHRSWLPASLAASLLLGLAGCDKDNPGYCGNECPVDADDIDAPSGCIANPGLCTGDLVCDTSDDTCVDCRMPNNHQSSECTSADQPVCGANRDCRACAADSECDSEFCDHGSCAPTGQVLFVRPNGDDGGGNMCTDKNAPCKTLTRAVAVTPTTAGSPATNRRFVKLMTVDTYPEPGLVSIDDKTMIIFGAPLAGTDRSVIDRAGNGVTMEIKGGAEVRLERLSVSNGLNNTSADGIVCSSATLVADGIEIDNNNGTGLVGDACKLTLKNSVISRNDEAGISVQGERVVIVNNVIVENGGVASAFGGLQLLGGVLNTSVVQSNTIAHNRASNGTQPDGIDCAVSGLTVANNIVYGTTDRQRVAGVCTFVNTVFGPTDNGLRLTGGAGNVLTLTDVDFKFTDAALRNYHIGATSVAKGKGTTTGLATEAMTDMDGQPRPQGACDVGADEIPD